MYKFSIEQVLDEQFLTKLVQLFKSNEVERFKTLDKYYSVKNKILERQMEQGKPNNRMAHGFSKYITNMATSYFMGKGVKYMIEDDEFKEKFNQCLNDT